MRSMPVLIGVTLLITATGYSEVLMTAQDYAVDSDVVLESVVREIKNIPSDVISVVGDSVKYVVDETTTAIDGIKSISEEDVHAGVQDRAQLAGASAWDSSNDILFRSYKINSDLGDLLMAEVDNKEVPSIDVSAFFKGIEFAENTSAQYLPEFNSLFVRQTLGGLVDIESMLGEYRTEQKELLGHQVEVETKFVEVSQTTMNELGFEWKFNGKNGDALDIVDDLTMPAQDILNDSLRTAADVFSGATSGELTLWGTSGGIEWGVLISALEQSEDSDVLSAPRVVTQDGSTAIIQVGEEEMFPRSFDIENSDTSPYIELSDWELELMGVSLEVTPEIREEGLIDLELHPKVIDVIGQDVYKVSTSYSGGAGSQAIPQLDGAIPYYRVREMETRVTVADGSTVGMGGLIYDKLETYRDKVPLLGSIPYIGRLFRSEGETSVKRNLMIFVTATQIDVDGRRASTIALKK